MTTGTRSGAHPVIGVERRARLANRVRLLVLLTIGYNLLEATVALTAGALAGSAALIGFGLDSVIEVSSAVAVLWQFSRPDHEVRERATLRVIAGSFLALAVFISYDAVDALVRQEQPDPSTIGIAVAALSLLVMPALSRLQRRTGWELGSHSAVADSRQTLLCACMSAVLLVGLLANAWLGWWWADPVAALGIAGLAVREGFNAWRGDACCTVGGLRDAHAVDPADQQDVRSPGDTCC
ncbi:cation diffusion facilitator family transporter [Nocardioides coralli]|uniref:cation diffusion facilitator family transporter n=1 Tax=Nocardioides coralli TaxID=2872154 RepID=UPI001CA415AB|nr:cation transporter [Nocardioides coralli]QZY30137.1 cation transporter [Nocardioides coralli]